MVVSNVSCITNGICFMDDYGRRKKRNYELVATWALESFTAISAEAIVSGFKKALLDEFNERLRSYESVTTILK